MVQWQCTCYHDSRFKQCDSVECMFKPLATSSGQCRSNIDRVSLKYNVCSCQMLRRQVNTGPLFTKKTPSYGYRDPHDKPKTVWRPSQVYNGNPYTDKTASSSWIEALVEHRSYRPDCGCCAYQYHHLVQGWVVNVGLTQVDHWPILHSNPCCR